MHGMKMSSSSFRITAKMVTGYSLTVLDKLHLHLRFVQDALVASVQACIVNECCAKTTKNWCENWTPKPILTTSARSVNSWQIIAP